MKGSIKTLQELRCHCTRRLQIGTINLMCRSDKRNKRRRVSPPATAKILLKGKLAWREISRSFLLWRIGKLSFSFFLVLRPWYPFQIGPFSTQLNMTEKMKNYYHSYDRDSCILVWTNLCHLDVQSYLTSSNQLEVLHRNVALHLNWIGLITADYNLQSV